MNPLLDIKNLSLQYPGFSKPVRAIENLSLSVRKGQIVGIVGESGSGKSSLCLSVLGLLGSPNRTQGQISFAGRDLRTLPAEEMRNLRGDRISMIFQNPSEALNPVLKVGDQIAETLWIHKNLNKKRTRPLVYRLMEQVGLEDPEALYDRYPHQFSGGEQQRILIASAIACQPELLLADEPTTALDTVVQRQIVELLLKFRKDLGMSVLYVSHDLALVSKIADYVYVMRDGAIVEAGEPEQLFSSPKSDYAKELIQSRGQIVRPPKKNSAGPKKPILEARELGKKFIVAKSFFGRPIRWKKAVSPLDLDVFFAETLGVVGESGSGKSTLALLLLALIKPSSGSIVLFGNNLWKVENRVLRGLRKKAQIVFQSSANALNPKRRVGEALAEPLKIHKLTKNSAETLAKVGALLRTVELDESYARKFPHELSGGEQQRVCIARALASDPEFVIFDESVRSLDASIQKEIANLLVRLQVKFNLTYVFISHDLDMVERLCDRVMVMHQGKVVEGGCTAEVFKNPKTPYLKSLLAARF